MTCRYRFVKYGRCYEEGDDSRGWGKSQVGWNGQHRQKPTYRDQFWQFHRCWVPPGGMGQVSPPSLWLPLMCAIWGWLRKYYGRPQSRPSWALCSLNHDLLSAPQVLSRPSPEFLLQLQFPAGLLAFELGPCLLGYSS